MNKKWNEKTTMEKGVDILSWIACSVVVVLLILKNTDTVENIDVLSQASLAVVSLCQAYVFWKEKRGISYIALGAAVLLIVCAVLSAMV